MQVALFDDRMVEGYRDAEFIASIYEGGDQAGYSWSEASYLFVDADLSGVLTWLRENLPDNSCWALGVVQRPNPRYEGWPLPEGRAEACDIAWIVGGDVLNMNPSYRSPEEERLAQSMLARRHLVQL